MSILQKVKGFQDIYGPDCVYWERAESLLRETCALYSVKQMRIPMLEKTELFNRGIGSGTDIVEKEMFTFQDRGGDSLSLRPEGTAGLVRSYVENGLFHPPALRKFYYLGPMFRRENPQKGRYRQFTQGGVEYLGSSSPVVDAEVISLLMTFFQKVGIGDLVGLEINSVGCLQCRPAYLKKLVDYFSPRADDLCGDCKRRLSKNPLRILDCKHESCKEVIKGAPVMLENLCGECAEHFGRVRENLALMGVAYTINPLMVRGLDYYVRTAFEAVTGQLGAASAIGAGGRYDGLVAMLGGPDLGGVGFAIGMDRVVALMKMGEELAEPAAAVFVASFESTRAEGIKLLSDLRRQGIAAEGDPDGGGLKAQMKKADRSGAGFAVIVGEDELSRGMVTLRNLKNSEQREILLDDLTDFFNLI